MSHIVFIQMLTQQDYVVVERCQDRGQFGCGSWFIIIFLKWGIILTLVWCHLCGLKQSSNPGKNTPDGILSSIICDLQHVIHCFQKFL